MWLWCALAAVGVGSVCYVGGLLQGTRKFLPEPVRTFLTLAPGMSDETIRVTAARLRYYYKDEL